jgi:hypothetical protein
MSSFEKQSAFTREDYVARSPVNAVKMSDRDMRLSAGYGSALTAEVTGDTSYLEQDYNEIFQALENEGYSQHLDNLSALVSTQKSEGAKRALIKVLADNTVSIERKAQLVEHFQHYQPSVDLAEDFRRVQIQKGIEDAVTATDIQLRKDRSDPEFAQESEEKSARVQAEENQVAGDFDASTMSAAAGLAALMVPFAEQTFRIGVQEAAFGEMSSWDRIYATLFPGSSTAAFKKNLNNLPPNLREQAQLNMIEFIKGMPGPDMLKYNQLQIFLDNPYENWQKWVDNAVGILDGLLIPGILWRGYRLVRPSINATSPIRRVEKSSPAESSKLGASAILDSTGAVARAMDTTQSVVAMNKILPKSSVDPTAPSDVIERVNWIKAQAAKIGDDTGSAGINYYDAEKVAAVQREVGTLQEKLSSVTGVNYNASMSVAEDTGESVLLINRFGRTSVEGWSSVKAASQAGTETFGKGKYKVVGFDPKANEVYSLKGGARKGSTYWVETTNKHIYNPTDAALFDIDTAVSWVARRSPRLAGYLQDSAARMDRVLSKALLRAQDRSLGIEATLIRAVERDLKALSRKERGVLWDILKKGSDDGRVYAWEDFRSSDFGGKEITDKVKAAYYSYRATEDSMWWLENRAFRSKLIAENRQLVIAGGNRHYVSRVESSVAKDSSITGRTFYDPTVGKIVKKTKQEIDSIYKEGGFIGAVRGDMRVKDEFASHMILDAKHTTPLPVPENPLPYIQGYYQRGYKEFFFIDRKLTKAIKNGKLVGRLSAPRDTLEATGTIKEAKKVVDRLNAERTPDEIKRGIEYDWRLGREFEDNYVEDFNLFNRTRTSSRRRGQAPLRGQSPADDLADRVDPLDAIFRSVRSLSEHLAYDDLVQSLQARFMNTFRDILDNPKQFPTDWKQITRPTKPTREAKDRYNTAVSLWENVQLLRRAPTTFERGWKRFMFNAADTMEGLLDQKWLSKRFRTLAKEGGNPLTWMKKVPTMMFISLRPFRQFFLQSGQILQLSFIDPKYIWRAPFDAWNLLHYHAWAMRKGGSVLEKAPKEVDSLVETATAKMMNMDVDELRVMREALFDRSGLPQSMDTNTLVEGWVRAQKNTVKSHLPSTLIVGPVQLAKKIGFDLGEYTNLASSWLVAKRLWQKANKTQAHNWAKKTNLDEISARAREISYSMTRPGSFKYQRGMMSIPMQFIAVPHKAMLSILPEALGGTRAWSKAEKVKIASANMLLFGGYTYGLMSLLEETKEYLGLDVDPETWDKYKGGMVDVAFNGFLQVIFDEKEVPEVQFSKAFTPFGDRVVPFGETIVSVLTEPTAQALLGPFGNILSLGDKATEGGELFKGRLVDSVRALHTVLNAPDIDILSNEGLALLEDTASIASGMSDFWKARMIFQYEKAFSQRGKEGRPVRAPTATAVAQLFGFSSRGEAVTFDVSMDQKKAKVAAEEHARIYIQLANKLSLTVADPTTSELDKQKLTRALGMVHWAFKDRPDLQVLVMNEIKKQLGFSISAKDNFVVNFLKPILAGGEIAREQLSNIDKAEHSGALDHDTADKLRNLLETALQHEETAAGED